MSKFIPSSYKRVKLNGYIIIPPPWQGPILVLAITFTILFTFLQEIL